MSADENKPSIAELQRLATSPPQHGTPPVRLTDAELTAQHAGYHDFNAIESMVVELRQHRRQEALVKAAPVLLEIAAAALAIRDAGCTCVGRMGTHYAACEITKAEHAMSEALWKVRP